MIKPSYQALQPYICFMGDDLVTILREVADYLEDNEQYIDLSDITNIEVAYTPEDPFDDYEGTAHDWCVSFVAPTL